MPPKGTSRFCQNCGEDQGFYLDKADQYCYDCQVRMDYEASQYPLD